MAITVWGVDPSITETEWSVLHKIEAEGAWKETVADDGGGLIPTAGGGTRQVSVTAGDCVAAGVLGRNTAPVTVTLDANGTGINRIDYVVFQINWSGTNTTGGSIMFVKGSTTTTTAPALTRTAGSIWQIPLARVTVAPGAGVFSGSAVEDVRPRRRRTIRYRNAPLGGQSMGAGVTSPNVIASILVADPGWPYKLRVYGQVMFAALPTAGYGRIDISLDNTTADATGRAGGQNQGQASVYWVSDDRTGSANVRLRMVPAGGMTAGDDPLVTSNLFSEFLVEVVPA